MSDLVERLRQGIDPNDISDAEREMDKAAAVIERLTAALDELSSQVEATEEHSPAQDDGGHYETDCPICNALTEAHKLLNHEQRVGE